jgi:hypothetical protein
MTMTNDPPVCDFCNRVKPRWEFPAEDFIAATIISIDGVTDHVITGGWLACEYCTKCIDAEDWEALFAYSADHAAEMYPKAQVGLVLLSVKTAHQQFQEHRQGDKVSFG